SGAGNTISSWLSSASWAGERPWISRTGKSSRLSFRPNSRESLGCPPAWAGRSTSCRLTRGHRENQGRPNDGVGEPRSHEGARCLGLHWPPAAGHSAEPVGHRASSAFSSSPPGNFGFVSAPLPWPFLI